MGIYHYRSRPRRPQTNGTVEVYNSTLKNYLFSSILQYIPDWNIEQIIQQVAIEYNSKEHTTTRFAPVDVIWTKDEFIIVQVKKNIVARRNSKIPESKY